MSYIENAVIVSVEINDGERELLTAWISVKLKDGNFQSFGGHALYLSREYSNHELNSYAGHFIYRCMQIAGVNSWEEMVGKAIRVRKPGEDEKIEAIGHIINDDWFSPSVDFSGQQLERADETKQELIDIAKTYHLESEKWKAEYDRISAELLGLKRAICGPVCRLIGYAESAEYSDFIATDPSGWRVGLMKYAKEASDAIFPHSQIMGAISQTANKP